MRRRLSTLIAVCLLATLGFAKDKKKNTLPTSVLRAQTVAVIIDPTAGFTIDDPRANEVARQDVESALLSWGRYNPILQTNDADLIVVVRTGNGRMVNDTIHDQRQNNRPGSVIPADNGVSISGQHGTPSPPQPSPEPTPQMDIGQTEDSFLVYEGGGDRPLDRAPAWRYIAKDGLMPHSVPAVDAFRKAVADAEKAAAKTP
jgi:hypothetical protein